jgi:hypothetical protein
MKIGAVPNIRNAAAMLHSTALTLLGRYVKRVPD